MNSRRKPGPWGAGGKDRPFHPLLPSFQPSLPPRATHSGCFSCKASRKYSSQDILPGTALAFFLPGWNLRKPRRPWGFLMEGSAAACSLLPTKAATKQALVAQATIHTTFHCLAEVWGIHPGRGREGAAGRGAASPASGEGFQSQSNSQSLHQEFTLLGGTMSGQTSSWLGGMGPPKHGCMLNCPCKRKLLGTHCLPGLGWSHLLPGKVLSAYHVPAL